MDAAYTGKFLRDLTDRSDRTEALSNDKILFGIYDAVAKGDYSAVAGYVSPEIEMRIAGCGQMDGRWRGATEVGQAIAANFQRVTGQKPVMEQMIVQGDSIAVLLNETGSFRDTGKSYSARAVQWFTFESGKLKKVEQIGSLQV
jgi:ketosteroid isomerase-like protein